MIPNQSIIPQARNKQVIVSKNGNLLLPLSKPASARQA